jgi:nitrate reductase gamma subunit
MKFLLPLVVVAGLFGAGLIGASAGAAWVLGVILPYAAAALFLAGIVWRVLSWANVPVPFRIPTTCGQQKTLPWIRPQRIDNPASGLAVVGRMALEILCFRSLLRDTRGRMVDGRLIYGTDLSLWLGGMAMHWAMLTVVVRHLRFFTEPVPAFTTLVSRLDGFLEVGLPVYYVSTAAFILGAAYLLFRRLRRPQVRYLSLASDYFPLFLLLGVGLSGFWLRHLSRTDVVAVKQLVLGLTHLTPVVPGAISPLFYGHLLLVCVLLAYLPFSKLCHSAGVFLSPTRNMANNNRSVRHVNPWNHPVKVHPYEEYEDELRDKMKAAGIPVEKE